MFLLCQKTQLLWQALEFHYGLPHVSLTSIQEAFIWWSRQRESWRPIFIITLWCIWRWRNNNIFKECKELFMGIVQSISSLFESIPEKPPKEKRSNPNMDELCRDKFLRVFFDGAAQNYSCGCGIHIILDENTQYFISWNGGKRSSCKAEAMALVGLLSFCIFFNIQSVLIFGDSKVMVDFALGRIHISNPYLAGWMNRIVFLWERMEGCSIWHIYRLQNKKADSLSKESLLTTPGIWHMKVFLDKQVFSITEFSFPDAFWGYQVFFAYVSFCSCCPHYDFVLAFFSISIQRCFLHEELSNPMIVCFKLLSLQLLSQRHGCQFR